MKLNKLQTAKVPTNKSKAQKHSDTKSKKNKSKNKENTVINFPEDDTENEDELPKKRSGGGPRFSPVEDEYIVKLAMTAEDVLSIEDLDTIARRCNKRYHNEQPIRTGEALWWRIRREQQRGNPVYENVSIKGGSPKRTPGTRFGRAATASNPALINNAMQPKRELEGRQTQKQNAAPRAPVAQKNKSAGLEIMVRNPATGEIQKFVTRKFSSVDELMFALA